MRPSKWLVFIRPFLAGFDRPLTERRRERSRSATPAAEPQTEARRSCGTLRMLARDERAICGVERASSRGIRGDGQPVERSKPRVGHGGFEQS